MPVASFTASALLAFSLPASHAAGLRAGAAKIDISPTQFPVIVNAMFTERSATRVVDPLMVRALVLENGATRIAIAVVDTCMIPRDLIDDAKNQASRVTGIPIQQMLISATHTHSAPSAMGCLGSRVDPRYAASLPAAIARAIDDAAAALEPVQAGWTVFDATGFTHNRRWIRRSDRLLTDPFGEKSVRAHMHPGHVSPDVIGPSGPVDPGFTLLSLVRPDGSPVAIFGNFSMHYYESDLVSSDYFGRWSLQVETALATERGRVRKSATGLVSNQSTAPRPVTAILSQGTSGDLMWMDYSQPRNFVGYDAYARALTERTLSAWRGIEHRAEVPLVMREAHLKLAYRVADEPRLAWARDLTARVGTRLPQNLPEIYAFEQLELARRGQTELVLQALRIGDLGITALPNEVYALTGLKLKARSPFPVTMNIELANGADGYIPPPEQHALGGYTTWAARTAGLEPQAEPRIVETLLGLLEEVSGRTRRDLADPETPWSRALLATRPAAYWKLDEATVGPLQNRIRKSKAIAQLDGRYALYLDGVDQPTQSGITNHAVHLVDGAVRLDVGSARSWSLSAWFWNGFPATAAAETGELLRGGPGGRGRLILAGTNGPAGRLQWQSPEGNLSGKTPLGWRQWHHVALVAKAGQLTIFLDGTPEIQTDLIRASESTHWVLGGWGTPSPFQGKLDELAWHTRALSEGQLRSLAMSTRPASLDRK